jgi:zinc protease
MKTCLIQVSRALQALLVSGLVLSCGGSQAGSQAESAASAGSAVDESWRKARPAPGAERALSYPGAQVAELPNGVKLYLVQRPAGTVALSVSSLAGGASCRKGESGLAALTLRLMTEATVNKNPLELAEAAESLGSSIEFDTGRDGSSVSMEVLGPDVEAGLALMAEVVTRPRFAAADVERVQRQWVDSLVSERQEPSRLSSLAGMRALLGPEVGAPVRGSVPDVKRLTRADLMRFHREHYVAGNLALIAVGDLTMERLQALATKGFGQLPAQKPPAAPERPSAPLLEKTRVWLVDRPGSVQSALFVGQPFPDRAAAGHEARQVMNNLLGGLFTSRLNSNLREKHAYTYGVRSLSIATRRWGAFISMSQIKTENTADALEQLTLELTGLKNGQPNPISDEELARSKTDLIHSLGANLEHVRRVLGDTGELYVDGLPADYHSRYPTLIAEVNREAAQAEAQRLTPDRLGVIVVGDEKLLEPLLAAKGWTVETAPAQFIE